MFIRTKSHYNIPGNCKLFLVNPRYRVPSYPLYELNESMQQCSQALFIYSQHILKCKCLLWIFLSIIVPTPFILSSCLLFLLDLIFPHTHIYHHTFLPIQYNKPSDLVVPEMVNGLQDNLDVVVSLAERHYYNCDFKMCYKLTSM